MLVWKVDYNNAGFLIGVELKGTPVEFKSNFDELNFKNFSISDKYELTRVFREVEALSNFDIDIENYKDLFNQDTISQGLTSYIDGKIFLSFLGLHILRTGIKGEDIPSQLVDFFESMNLPKYEVLCAHMHSQNTLQRFDYNVIANFNLDGESVAIKTLKGDILKTSRGVEILLFPSMARFVESYIKFQHLRSEPEFRENQIFRRNLTSELLEYAELSGVTLDQNLYVNKNTDLKGLKYQIIRTAEGELFAKALMREDLASFEGVFNQHISSISESFSPQTPLYSVIDKAGRSLTLALNEKNISLPNKIKKFNSLPDIEKENVLTDPIGFFLEEPSAQRTVSLSTRVEKILFGRLKSEMDSSLSKQEWFSAFEGNTNFFVKRSDGQITELIESDGCAVYENLHNVEIANGAEHEVKVNGNSYTLDKVSADIFTKVFEKVNQPSLNADELDYALQVLADADSRGSTLVEWNDNSIPKASLKVSLDRAIVRERRAETTAPIINVVPGEADGEDSTVEASSSNYVYDLNPKCFKEEMELRQLQKDGLSFIRSALNTGVSYVRDGSRGVIVADDMGVGKTAQVLGHISDFLENENWNEKSILLVAPVSLIESSWIKDGFKKFIQDMYLYNSERSPCFVSFKQAPKVNKKLLSEYLLSISEEEALMGQYPEQITNEIIDIEDWCKGKIVLISYESLRSNSFVLSHVPFDLVVLDEAQKIKNKGSQQSNAAKSLKAKRKIAMTGTPIENTIMELWNIIDFIHPGRVGTRDKFKEQFQAQLDDALPGSALREDLVSKLKEMIKPFFLRRTKKDLSESGFELPEITYHDDDDSPFFKVEMSASQVASYKNTLLVRQNGAGGASAVRSLIDICNANWLSLPGQHDDFSKLKNYILDTPKLGLLLKILNHINNIDDESQKGVLLFCNRINLQNELKHILEDWHYEANGRRINIFVYNGTASANDRARAVNDFNEKSEGFNVLILSPKAGGVGLNLQRASHIIHYTREWNPAIENQANCRAYRSGQKNPVHVYYPTSVGSDFISAEEKLADLLAEKRSVVDDFTVTVKHLAIDPDELIQKENLSPEWAKPLELKDIVNITPDQFEYLTAMLYEKSGYQVEKVGGAGDDGADVLARINGQVTIIQVKHANGPSKLNVDAAREVINAARVYQSKGEASIRMAVVTNRSQSTHSCMVECSKSNIKLQNSQWLSDKLDEFPITIGDLNDWIADHRSK